MIENYVNYLDFINKKLEKFFDRQKPYIFCKKGCSKCCQNAQFPYSQLEMTYLLKGSTELSIEIQDIVTANITKILKEKADFKGEKFKYNCPFLIDNSCCIYNFRGIVCRTFGLMGKGDDENRTKVPFCAFEGLNYSNVVDIEKNNVSEEKFKALGIEQEPLGFNIGYDFLTNPDFEKAFKIKFGEKKPLIDWFNPKNFL